MTIKKEKSVLAKNIVTRRTKFGWSAEKLSEEARIPYPTLRDIEAGISGGRQKTLDAIAKTLECTVGDLYQSDKPTPGVEELAALVTNQKQRMTQLEADYQELKSRLGISADPYASIPTDVLEALSKLDKRKYVLVRALLGIDDKKISLKKKIR